MCHTIKNKYGHKYYFSKSIELVGAKIPRQNGLTGNGVKVGIIDTGIDYTHNDLHGFGNSGKVVGGHSYVGTLDNPIDTNGHGTEVAGIICIYA